MALKPKISIGITDYYRPGKSFSVRIKNDLLIEPLNFIMPRKIMAIGNVHGSFTKFAKTLIRKRIINHDLQWIFGNGHLVIMDDFLSAGAGGVESLWLIYSLEDQAQLFGGRIHFILGKEDVRALSTDWRKIHPTYAKRPTSDGQIAPGSALFLGNGELTRWMRTKQTTVLIGDTLFATAAVEIQWDVLLVKFKCVKLITTLSGENGIRIVKDHKVILINADRTVDPVCLLLKRDEMYQLLRGSKAISLTAD